MPLRALEPEDLTALAALCARPAVAQELDEVPGEASLQTAPGLNLALGLFDGPDLLAAAGMKALERPRIRHAGAAWLVSAEPERSVELLAAVVSVADRWWHLDRLELSLPADSANLAAAARAGLQREVHRRCDLARDGALVDTVEAAWIRPGVVSSAAPRPFPRAERAPLPASLELRPTRPTDAPGFTRALADPGVVWGTLQTPFTPGAVWRKRLGTNDPARNKSFVALADGEVVASCGLHGAPGRGRQHVWGLGMSVRDAWQGRGLGKALMQKLVETADSLQFLRVELDVYTDNLRAIALYEQFGFVREGVKRLEAWRDGGYADALVMARVR